jgi:hypothetical protein
MAVDPETPTASSEQFGDLTLEQEQLLMRTAPARRTTFADLGQGVLGEEKDQHVLLRLMAARRKSLQFAPKVASPLSRTWE